MVERIDLPEPKHLETVRVAREKSRKRPRGRRSPTRRYPNVKSLVAFAVVVTVVVRKPALRLSLLLSTLKLPHQASPIEASAPSGGPLTSAGHRKPSPSPSTPTPQGPSDNEALFSSQLHLVAHSEAVTAKEARIQSVDLPDDPKAPCRGPLYMDASSMEVGRGFLRHHVGSPDDGLASDPAGLADQIRDVLADSAGQERGSALDLPRHWRRLFFLLFLFLVKITRFSFLSVFMSLVF